MAGLDLLPSSRSARRRGSHEYSLRHERRRSALGMARRRSRRTSWSLDARGARVTTVLPDGRAAYDGRATAEENWFRRTGLAYQSGQAGRLRHADVEPVDVRYLDVLPLPDGGSRIYYEARLPDESHELRTELVVP